LDGLFHFSGLIALSVLFINCLDSSF